MGTVYLIHFDQKIGNPDNSLAMACHYLGYTSNLKTRLLRHKEGRGAKIMSFLFQQGIGWKVVRTWCGGRKLERALKNQRNAPRLCPVCNPKLHKKGR